MGYQMMYLQVKVQKINMGYQIKVQKISMGHQMLYLQVHVRKIRIDHQMLYLQVKVQKISLVQIMFLQENVQGVRMSHRLLCVQKMGTEDQPESSDVDNTRMNDAIESKEKISNKLETKIGKTCITKGRFQQVNKYPLRSYVNCKQVHGAIVEEN